MQIAFHIGAPCTDEDGLVKSLLKNRAALAQEGIVVPTPGRYRDVIRDLVRALDGAKAPPEMQEAVFDAMMDEDGAERLVLSDPKIISINRLVVQGAQIWPTIERVAGQLRNLFPEAHVEFMVGMRDPATLIPALFKASRFAEFEEFTENMQPHALAWSEMLMRLRRAHPECPVTAWCNEDTPLLWGSILREMSGCDALFPLEGVDDLLAEIMEPAGLARMQGYLRNNPPENEVQRRRVVSVFLDKYAREEEIEEEIDAPGWSEEMLEDMSDAYEDDMDAVARIPGVTLLTP